MLRIPNFIGGRFVEPIGGDYLDNVEPATGETYSLLADSDERDVDAAVRAAEQAFPAWSRMPAEKRSNILLRLADLIDAHLQKLAKAESIDTGKPIALARTVDIPRAAANFRFFATAILHDESESHQTDDRALNYTLRQPRGVAGLISPWNLPLYLFTWKIAPALATGNTAVGKPSELTPMTAHLLAQLCDEAGVPHGVLNIVHGRGARAGAALVAHPSVSAISFTGGTKTGAEISRIAAPMFKKISLELGGKNPNIVFADADLDQAIATSVRAAFSNQGQICLCGSRIFVQRSICDHFVNQFVHLTKQLKLGDPLDDATEQGALNSRAHLDKVMSYIELSRSEGGKVVSGGEPPPPVNDRCRNGFFLKPTVITGLSATCRTNREEIFGPVVTITAFDDEVHAIEYANCVEYGLSASVWTRDVDRVHRISSAIHAGTVWVNCWMLRDLRVPFGGTKQSGVGREGGQEALRFFTEAKNVCIQLNKC